MRRREARGGGREPKKPKKQSNSDSNDLFGGFLQGNAAAGLHIDTEW